MNSSQLFFICFAFVFLSCGQISTHQIYKDSVIEVRESSAVASLHGGQIRTAVIAGNQYSGICGKRPFYSTSPKTSIIVFVTARQDERYGERFSYYFYNTKSNEIVMVDGRDCDFGNHIGDPPGAKVGSDYIDDCTSETIALKMDRDEIKRRLDVDLSSRKVVNEEEWEFNESGQEISHVKELHIFAPNR